MEGQDIYANINRVRVRVLVPPACARLRPFRLVAYSRPSVLSWVLRSPASSQGMDFSVSAWPLLGQTASAGLFLISFHSPSLWHHLEDNAHWFDEPLKSKSDSAGRWRHSVPLVSSNILSFPNLSGCPRVLVHACTCTHRNTSAEEAWDTVSPPLASSSPRIHLPWLGPQSFFFVCLLLFYLFFFFRTGSHYAALTVLELTLYTRPALNSQRSCLCLTNAGIKRHEPPLHCLVGFKYNMTV